MQTICFLATCQSQHILCTHCWVELSLMLSTLLYFIIVILILLVINRCLINCSHYLIYFAIVNSFLYVLFVGIPTCNKTVTSPPRFLHASQKKTCFIFFFHLPLNDEVKIILVALPRFASLGSPQKFRFILNKYWNMKLRNMTDWFSKCVLEKQQIFSRQLWH